MHACTGLSIPPPPASTKNPVHTIHTPHRLALFESAFFLCASFSAVNIAIVENISSNYPTPTPTAASTHLGRVEVLLGHGVLDLLQGLLLLPQGGFKVAGVHAQAGVRHLRLRRQQEQAL